MNRSSWINVGSFVTIFVFTLIVICLQNSVQLVPSGHHPLASVGGVIMMLVFMLIGFYKALDLIEKIFDKLRSKSNG